MSSAVEVLTRSELDDLLDVAHPRDIFEPRISPEGETVEEIADGIRGYLRSMEALNLIYREGAGYGALSDDARSARRIERWASTEPPPRS